MSHINHKLCVAPMMTHTDRHFRYLLRLISPHVMLYTEMITTGALIHGNAEKYLAYNHQEHPVAVQLGGSKIDELKQCAKFAEDAGYDEINMNVGCPSNKVQTGQFGACLMARPEHVAECVSAMQDEVNIPVTVKNRIGIDTLDSYEFLYKFISTIANSGCKTFIIHARKALLSGLSPRQNREIPPLDYDTIYQIKKDFPDLEIVINGGFTSVEQIQEQYRYVDGVMVGRAACNNPYLLTDADKKIYGNTSHIPSRYEILDRYTEYVEMELNKGESLGRLGRHLLGLFQGQAGARAYRRYLSENIYQRHTGIEVIKQAMALVK